MGENLLILSKLSECELKELISESNDLAVLNGRYKKLYLIPYRDS